MSYIVCSNAENEDEYDNGGFSNPASFANHYKSPLLIEPDSEVAVESVKIDRRSAWTIKESDKFFVYYGPEQDPTGSVYTNSGEVTKNGVRIDIRPGSYNKEQMLYELDRALNKAPLGPLLYNNVSVIENTDSVTGQFKGFQFGFTSRSAGENVVNAAAAGTDALAPGDFVSANGACVKYDADNGNPAYEYDDSEPTEGTLSCLFDFSTIYPGLDQFTNIGGAITRLQSPAISIRHPKGPLSQIGGQCIFDFTGAFEGGAFSIGLSRPTTPWWRYGFPSINTGPPNSVNNAGSLDRRSNFVYNDFWLHWNPEAGAVVDGSPEGQLKVFSWGYDSVRNNWNIKEMKYYDNPNYAGVGGVSPINGALLGNYDRIKWSIDGNEVCLALLHPSDTAQDLKVVGDMGNNARTWSFPPLHNGTEALVPNIQMVSTEQSLILKQYNVNIDKNMAEWFYPSHSTGTPLRGDNYPLQNGTIIPGADWYSNAELRNNSGGELRYNQLRPSLLYANSATEVYTYSKLGGLSYIDDYVPVIVLGQENRVAGISDFNQVLYVIPDPEFNRPNMRRHLGFGGSAVANYSEFQGATDDANFKSLVSIEAGTLTVHSAFIRINDLPVQTFNGATSSRSNIVYHIPRFSQDGRQFGELYFQAPEKTYLKLNNTERITLSQIKIDIVGRNERIVEDLQGATIVCLHIRENHHKK